MKAGHSRGRICEAPIFFGDRRAGESKMNWREQANYLRHLRRLYHYRWPKAAEALQFGFVGFIGFLWDALFYVGLQAAGLSHLWARALAFWPGVTSNWFLNRVMTFKERPRTGKAAQWARFAAGVAGGLWNQLGRLRGTDSAFGFFFSFPRENSRRLSSAFWPGRCLTLSPPTNLSSAPLPPPPPDLPKKAAEGAGDYWGDCRRERRVSSGMAPE